ncbi:MAG: hypothetical protein J5818_00250 [Eggerthellaceae bacterium]|nr:hypothetical protein [Eggerthellaceae bacterium]
MSFSIVRGEEVDVGYLDALVRIDQACYEPAYWGDPANMAARFEKNRQSFVFVVDDDADDVAGYINFFPCEQALYEENVFTGAVIRDDDITPDEVAPYRTDENHLFVLSLAIHPDYQGTDVIKLLTSGFVDYLNYLQDECGYPITDISATAVSADGRKALRNMLFREVRTLSDCNVVYLCDEKRLGKLLAGDFYFKSYRDDFYVLIPLAEHEANLRVQNALDDAQTARKRTSAYGDGELADGGEGGEGGDPNQPLASLLIDEISYYVAYECSNEVVDDMEFLDLGTYDFLCTTDEYPFPVENPRKVAVDSSRTYQQASPAVIDPNDRDREIEVVLGDAPGHLMLAAHRQTHLFVLTVLFSNFAYSTTQMEDQVSFGYLKIRNPENPDEYIPFSEFLLRTYGLHGCGQAKCISYLSNMPGDEQELQDMLAAEAFNNMENEYSIASDELLEQCHTNRAQFEDYEVHLSSRAIVYRCEDYSDDPRERISEFADYLFIVIMTLFQNAALAKVNIKVTNLLETDGDVSPRTKLAIDREYGRTIRFWEMQNFKYLTAQIEGSIIKEAFLNSELREAYDEHQNYLEHVVEVKAAIADNRNGMIINIIATLLAIVSIQPFVIELLQGIYAFLGIEADYASLSFNYGVFGTAVFFLLVLITLRRRDSYMQKKRM